MNILKTATEWARAELFSTSFFILFGIIFILASIGFWQLGKTDFAKAYVMPTLVAGTLLTIIGLGLTHTNYSRTIKFASVDNRSTHHFIEAEINRVERTLKEYKIVVFTAIPLIITACALGLIFVTAPIWRASLITTVAMMAVILLIDSTAHARIKTYYEALLAAN